MKKNTLTLFTGIALIAAIGFSSCNKDDNNPTLTEFIADDDSFKDFMSWMLETTTHGPDPALGMAHAGNDSTVSREIYFKDGASTVGGEYPVGTIIVKHSTNPEGTVDERTAMVKRGNGFNPEGGDWEWFMLAADGTIGIDETSGMAMRGADLMSGMCVTCHKAAETDYVYSK